MGAATAVEQLRVGKQCVSTPRGVLVVAWKHVGVDRKRHSDVGVADALAQRLYGNPCGESSRCVAVAEVVEANRWQIRGGNELCEQVAERLGVRSTAINVRDYESRRSPRISPRLKPVVAINAQIAAHR